MNTLTEVENETLLTLKNVVAEIRISDFINNPPVCSSPTIETSKFPCDKVKEILGEKADVVTIQRFEGMTAVQISDLNNWHEFNDGKIQMTEFTLGNQFPPADTATRSTDYFIRVKKVN